MPQKVNCGKVAREATPECPVLQFSKYKNNVLHTIQDVVFLRMKHFPFSILNFQFLVLAYLGHLHLFLCIELRVCRGLLAHAELEQNRRYQRSNDNDQYNRREHVRVDQTGLLALLCYDQRNLTMPRPIENAS